MPGDGDRTWMGPGGGTYYDSAAVALVSLVADGSLGSDPGHGGRGEGGRPRTGSHLAPHVQGAAGAGDIDGPGEDSSDSRGEWHDGKQEGLVMQPANNGRPGCCRRCGHAFAEVLGCIPPDRSLAVATVDGLNPSQALVTVSAGVDEDEDESETGKEKESVADFFARKKQQRQEAKQSGGAPGQGLSAGSEAGEAGDGDPAPIGKGKALRMIMPARASACMLTVGVATIILSLLVLGLSFAFSEGYVAPVPVMAVSLYVVCIGALGVYAALNTAQIASCSAILLFFASVAALLAVAVFVSHQTLLHGSIDRFVDSNLDTLAGVLPARLYDGAAAEVSGGGTGSLFSAEGGRPWWTARADPGEEALTDGGRLPADSAGWATASLLGYLASPSTERAAVRADLVESMGGYWWAYLAGVLLLVAMFLASAVASAMLVQSYTVSGVLFVAVGAFMQLAAAAAQVVVAVLLAIDPVPVLEDYALVAGLCGTALLGVLASGGVWAALSFKTRPSVLGSMLLQLLACLVHAGALYLLIRFLDDVSGVADSQRLTDVLRWAPELGIDTRSTAYAGAAAALDLFSTDVDSAQKATIPLREAVAASARQAGSGLLWMQLVVVAVSVASGIAARLFLRSMDTVALLLTPEGILHSRDLAKKADVVEMLFAKTKKRRTAAAAAIHQRIAKRRRKQRRRRRREREAE